MFVKVFLLAAALTVDLARAEAETVKRELVGHQTGLEFLQLGTLGPVAGLAAHPAFARLGLTRGQVVGVVGALLRNGLLHPLALRLPDGRPLVAAPAAPAAPAPFFAPLPVDPYVSFLSANYGRFLPFGLGPHGFFGSTGLPRPRPLGVFRYDDKN